MSSSFAHVGIDAVRDYWNRRPCNLRHSPSPVGSREYFDQVEARKYLVEPHIPGFAEFERWKGRRVLEIGCGLGTDTMNFARAGARVTAIDLSDESLSLARQRAAVMDLDDRITFLKGNAEELDQLLSDQQFDLIYSFGVIHHTPHPDRVFAHLRRYLASTGTLKVMMYHRRSWKVLGILLSSGQPWRLADLPAMVARHSEAQTGCPVTYTYTRREMANLLRTHGFTPQRIAVDHIFPYRVEDYVQYRYVKEWYFRWVPRPAFRALERTLGWHLCATATPAQSPRPI